MSFPDVVDVLLTAALVLLWAIVLVVYLRRLSAGKLDRALKALVMLLALDALRGLLAAAIGGGVVSPDLLTPGQTQGLLLGLRLVGTTIGIAALLVLTRLWLPKAIAERETLAHRAQ